jgi:hypothetical protein
MVSGPLNKRERQLSLPFNGWKASENAIQAAERDTTIMPGGGSAALAR